MLNMRKFIKLLHLYLRIYDRLKIPTVLYARGMIYDKLKIMSCFLIRDNHVIKQEEMKSRVSWQVPIFSLLSYK